MNTLRGFERRANATEGAEGGFTLVEIMITCVIVSILAAIALPAYSHYILKGKLSEAPNNLATARTTMEQWYQDNKTYANSGATGCGGTMPSGTYFTYSCATANSGATYTVTATGQAGATGYTYTVTNANVMATTSVGTGAKCTTSASQWNITC